MVRRRFRCLFCLDLDQVTGAPVTVEGVNLLASGIHLLDLANGWVIDGFDTHQPGPASIDGVEAGFTLSCIDFSTFESFWVQADLAKFELATTDALISDLIDLIGNLDLRTRGVQELAGSSEVAIGRSLLK